MTALVRSHIQSVLGEYAESMDFGADDFFYCGRGRCTMLKVRCGERLAAALSKKRATVYSNNVHCVQCGQGFRMTGLWIKAPYRVCMVLTCDNPVTSNGLCDTHYARLRRGIESKACATCEKDVALADYHDSTTTLDGKQYSCKKCQSAASAKQWLRKKEERKNNETNRD